MNKKVRNIVSALSAALMSVFFVNDCVAPVAAADGTTSTGGSASSLIILVVLIAVFYFFMIRPENKKKKAAEQMRESLEVGDKITTIGGMVGKIVNISGDLITFETGEDRVRIQVTKWAISTNGIQKKENEEAAK